MDTKSCRNQAQIEVTKKPNDTLQTIQNPAATKHKSKRPRIIHTLQHVVPINTQKFAIQTPPSFHRKLAQTRRRRSFGNPWERRRPFGDEKAGVRKQV
jgi:hypothetical protein